MNTTYEIRKHFLSGILQGLTITEYTSIRFELGKVYAQCITGAKYKIESIIDLTLEANLL